jgi:hypothetical protein
MGKRKEDKGRQPPWISVYRHTWKSAAWKMLSVGAKALYVELAANYNTKSQNSVFMSARTGAKQLNADKDCITKWLRELEHYGFIIKVSGGAQRTDGAVLLPGRCATRGDAASMRTDLILTGRVRSASSRGL